MGFDIGHLFQIFCGVLLLCFLGGLYLLKKVSLRFRSFLVFLIFLEVGLLVGFAVYYFTQESQDTTTSTISALPSLDLPESLDSTPAPQAEEPIKTTREASPAPAISTNRFSKRFLALPISDEAKQNFTLGEQCKRDGMFEKAEGYYNKTLEILQKTTPVNEPAVAMVFFRLSDLLRISDQADKALAMFQKTLKLFEDCKDHYGIGMVVSRVGIIYYHLGRFDLSRSAQERAIKVFSAAEDRHGLGTAYYAYAGVLGALGEIDRSRDYYDKALDLYQESGRIKGVGFCSLEKARLLIAQGNVKEARIYAQKALSLFKQSYYDRGEGKSLQVLGDIELEAGEREKARFFYTQSLNLLEHVKDRRGVARGCSRLADFLYHNQQYEQGLIYAQKALHLFDQIKDEYHYHVTLGIQSKLERVLGHGPEASTHATQAITFLEKVGAKPEVANMAHALGVQSNFFGYHAQALTFFEKALAFYTSANMYKKRGWALLGMGASYFYMDKVEKARSYFYKALDIFKNKEDKLWEAKTLRFLGKVEIKLGNFSEARNLLDSALVISRLVGSPLDEARAHRGLGVLDYHLGFYETAKQHYETAILLSEKIDYKCGLARALCGKGQIEFVLGNYDIALALYQKALEVGGWAKIKYLDTDCLQAMGALETRLGKLPGAEKHLQSALEILQKYPNNALHSQVLLTFGEIEIIRGNYKKAGDLFEQALKITEGSGDRILHAESLLNLARIQLKRGQIDLAQINGEKAHIDFQQMGCQRDLGLTLQLLGLMACYSGDSDKGLPRLEKALDIFKKIGDRPNTGRTLTRLGILKKQQNRSLALLEEALTIAKQTKDVMDILYAQSTILYRESSYENREETIKKLQGLKEQCLKLNILPGAAVIMLNIVRVMMPGALHNEALQIAKEAYKMFSSFDHAQGKVDALSLLGRVSRQNNSKEAKKFFEEALAQASKISAVGSEVSLLRHLANLFYKNKDFENAESYYEKSLHIAHRIRDEEQSALTALKLSTLKGKYYKEYAPPKELFESTLRYFKSVNNFPMEIETLLRFGNFEYAFGNMERAAELYQQALNLSEYTHHGFNKVKSLLKTSKIYLKKQEDKEAWAILKTVSEKALAGKMYLLYAKALTRMGGLLEKQQKHLEAEKLYLEALAYCEKLNCAKWIERIKNALSSIKKA